MVPPPEQPSERSKRSVGKSGEFVSQKKTGKKRLKSGRGLAVVLYVKEWLY